MKEVAVETCELYTLTNLCYLFQSEIARNNPLATDIILAPIFLMTMCARGFVLWIMNVGLVIYLGVAARKLNKKVLCNNYTMSFQVTVKPQHYHVLRATCSFRKELTTSMNQSAS
jgi:hypothetical protein